jgi:16S rRNA (guanine527-N7)-methyltransferase
MHSERLGPVLDAHGISLPPPQIDLLEQYCRLLWDWNTKINLTRHTDLEKFVARDLVDSLAISRFLEPKEDVLDVGTGGGVPGVILAVVRPDLSVSFSESVGKRARVLGDIVERLAIKATVYPLRSEAVLAQKRFNTLVVRAVAPMPKLLRWFRPHWDRFDRMLVLKGPAWLGERSEARRLGLLDGLELKELTSYPLPGTDSQSVLVQIRANRV